MNITALRPKLIQYLEPLSEFFFRAGFTPNQVSLLSLLFGIVCAVLFAERHFVVGSFFLLVSAVLDLVDGSVARKLGRESTFGAVFDWIADKYVDMLILFGIGISGIPIITHLLDLPPIYDFGVVALAIIGSMMNTFIKPVVYAEAGFQERVAGKIEDPLEGIGFFGRPETVLVVGLGALTGLVWISVILVAVGTNLSAIQRIVYLYRRL
ncbi:MAG: CDP-alcohol phosphatidyltransferase family protein [Methanomicrobiales archaeon]|nr:CDP-alcohol phosphatidyltransferase family protein [Methanomicrobiales archaeon]MDI6877284.1 CDP-alcohol phosphatidyltransferase family protein [Methanomicrobiales archaeon]